MPQLPSVSELLTSTSIPSLLQKTKSITDNNNRTKNNQNIIILNDDTSPKRQDSTSSTNSNPNALIASQSIPSTVPQPRRLTDSSIYVNVIPIQNNNSSTNLIRSNSSDYFQVQSSRIPTDTNGNASAGPGLNFVTTPTITTYYQQPQQSQQPQHQSLHPQPQPQAQPPHQQPLQQRNNSAGYQYGNTHHNITTPNLSPRSIHNNHYKPSHEFIQKQPPPSSFVSASQSVSSNTYPNSQYLYYSEHKQPPPPQHQYPPPPPPPSNQYVSVNHQQQHPQNGQIISAAPLQNVSSTYYSLPMNVHEQKHQVFPNQGYSHPPPPLVFDENNALINKRRVIKRRTRTGCLTCRKRRIKCDERKPSCYNCERSKKVCLGYENLSNLQPRKRTRDTSLDLPQEDDCKNDKINSDDNEDDEMSNTSPTTSIPKSFTENLISFDSQPKSTTLPPISAFYNKNNNNAHHEDQNNNSSNSINDKKISLSNLLK